MLYSSCSVTDNLPIDSNSISLCLTFDNSSSIDLTSPAVVSYSLLDSSAFPFASLKDSVNPSTTNATTPIAAAAAINPLRAVVDIPIADANPAKADDNAPFVPMPFAIIENSFKLLDNSDINLYYKYKYKVKVGACMSLITCPECGSMISDKSKSCVHCGYPIEQLFNNNVCIIDGVSYDLSIIVSCVRNGKYKDGFIKLHKLTNEKLSIYNCMQVLEYIESNDNVPSSYTSVNASNEDEKRAATQIMCKKDINKSTSNIRCPYCKSNNISKIGVFSRSLSTELFGFGSSKIGKQWHCKNCNSDF